MNLFFCYISVLFFFSASIEAEKGEIKQRNVIASVSQSEDWGHCGGGTRWVCFTQGYGMKVVTTKITDGLRPFWIFFVRFFFFVVSVCLVSDFHIFLIFFLFLCFIVCFSFAVNMYVDIKKCFKKNNNKFVKIFCRFVCAAVGWDLDEIGAGRCHSKLVLFYLFCCIF